MLQNSSYREQGTGNREQATGNRQQATEIRSKHLSNWYYTFLWIKISSMTKIVPY